MECTVLKCTKIQDEQIITLGKRIHVGHIHNIIYNMYVYICIHQNIYKG